MAQRDDKRQIRKLKKVIKRSGSKHRRLDLKRQLAEDPEDAHHHEESLGRHLSKSLNGLDLRMQDSD